ncbi:MAG: sigma 54-interacting transcriptional regulator, partial [Gemmatimonadetes bacterium]|nr:sigma 54-interacting transcriptional regulator [Gemmatimonadota bacterium]
KTHHDYCRKRNYPMAIADKRQGVIEDCVTGKEAITFEEVWTDKQGRNRNYVRTFSPVLDAAGNVTHVLAYGQEITDLKTAEDELRRALAEVETLKDRLQAENLYLQEEIKTHHNFAEIVGRSIAIQNVLEAVETVAPTEANVVITGETGTGKELVARAVHALSPRKDKPLIKVNCASIPRELFESEFFGHVRGAFTGAIRDRVGRFQLADGGTLFLDEVGEIPLEMQSKLLRVIQDGEYERVGDGKTRTVDVRIITATNRDLKQEVEAGRFRQDLYYRFNVFPIEVAPLRHRREDIPLLATRYVEQAARKLNRPMPHFTTAEVRRLQEYDWPGNVRELQNVIERALITQQPGRRLHFDLPSAGSLSQRRGKSNGPSADSGEDVIPELEMRRRERENLLAALRQTNWRIYGPGGAADLLGVKPTTLTSRVRKMGLERPRPK